MALPDLTGQNIENTYQRVIQTDGTNFYDGTGSLVNLVTGSIDTDPFPYTGSAAISGGLEVTGDVTIYGTASIDVLITNYESSSIIYSSGSTKFGDSLDDTHIFTGSVNVTGSLDVNDSLNVGPTGSLTVTGSINLVGYDADSGAKSDIIFSVDAARTANRFYVNNDGGFRAASTSYYFQYFPGSQSTGRFDARLSTSKYTTFDNRGFAFGSRGADVYVDDTSMVYIKGDNNPAKYALKIEDYNDTELLTVKNDGTVNITGSLITTGSISSTDTVTAVTGSFSHLKGNSPITVQDPVTFQHGDGIDILGPVTASQIQLGTATIYSGSTRTSIGIGRTPYFYAGDKAITANRFYTADQGSASQPALYIGSNGGGSGRGIYGAGGNIGFAINNQTTAYIAGRTNANPGNNVPRFGIGINPSAIIDAKAHITSTRDYFRISGSSVTNNPEVFLISSSGNTGIGTWSPNHKLEVVGEVSASTYYGDGSNLTGIETDPFPYTGSAVISGSLTVSGSTFLEGNLDLNGNSITEVDNISTSTSNVKLGDISGTTGGVNSVYIGSRPMWQKSGNEVVAIGSGVFRHSSSSPGASVGIGSGASSYNRGTNSVVIGKDAFLGNSSNPSTSGNNVTIIGYQAAKAAEGVNNVVAIGYQALTALTTGVNNTAVGYQAGAALTTGNNNTFFGLAAGAAKTTGHYNTIIGRSAGANSGATKQNQTLVGYAAGQYNNGESNSVLGMGALQYGSTSNSVAIGQHAIHTGGGGNDVAVGRQAGRNSSGGNNVSIGFEAGLGVQGTSTFANTVAVGYQAGTALTTGGSNILIGYQAGSALTTESNKLYIENSDSSTPLIYGEFDNDLVRINGTFETSGSTTISGSLTVNEAIYTTLIEAASGSDGTTSSGASITIKGQDSTPDNGAGGNVYIKGGTGSPQSQGTIYIGNVANPSNSYYNRLLGSTRISASGPNTGNVFQILAGGYTAFQIGYNNLTSKNIWTVSRNLEIVGGDSYTFDNNTTISGSLTVSQSVSASTYYGDGSNLTGIETDPFPYTGSAVISGSLDITGSLEISNPLTSSQYVKVEYNQSDDYRTRLTIGGPVVGTWDGGGEIMLKRNANSLLLSAFGSTGNNTPHIQSSGTELVFADSLNPNSNGGYNLGLSSRRWGTFWGNNLDIKSTSSNPTVIISGSNDLSGNYALKVANNSGTDILTVENDGKVGINVSDPSYDLHLPTSAVVKIGNLTIDADGNSGAGTKMLSGGSEITIGSDLIPQPTGYNLGKSSRVWGSLYMNGNIYGSLGGSSTPGYWGFLATGGYRDDSFYSYLPPLVSFAIGNTPSTYRGYFGLIQPSGSDNLSTDASTKFGLFVIGPGGRTILGKTQYNRTNDSIPTDKMFTVYDGETSTNELFYITTGSGDAYIKGDVSASTYYGDGSNLTGISSDPFPYTGSAVISGSLEVIGDITGSGKFNLNDGGNNVVIGYKALFSSTTSGLNVAVGYQAGLSLTTGQGNAFFGYRSGEAFTNQSNSVIIGDRAVASNASSNSVFIGKGVRSNSTAGNAVAIGENAEAGYNNVAVGKYAEANGAYTVSVGWYANQNGSAANSVFVGYNTGRGVGSTNVAVGGRSLYFTNGTGNTILGTQAFDGGGNNNDNNTVLGHNAGHSGTGNVLIGKDAGNTGLLNNKLYIENSNSATPLIYGEFDNDLVRINGKLYVSNSLDITGSVSASTYYGDGSNLTGISSDPFPYTGSAVISGSLTLTGSFNALLPTSSTDTYFVTYNTASYELEARQVATLINPKVEYLDVTASISSGTSITLPNGLSYISSSTYEYLEVFFNGLRLRYDRDFIPTSTTTIQNQITFPSGSELTFKSLKA